MDGATGGWKYVHSVMTFHSSMFPTCFLLVDLSALCLIWDNSEEIFALSNQEPRATSGTHSECMIQQTVYNIALTEMLLQKPRTDTHK